MMSITTYRVAPILRTAILHKIKQEGLIKAEYDDPIEWYKRKFCRKPRSKQEQHTPKYGHVLMAQAS